MSDPQVPLETLVSSGTMHLVGRIAWSSNGTFLVELPGENPRAEPTRAVYKPERGERPLGDFPAGIWHREVAASQLAQALGWAMVPETITVVGPYGVGSLQRFVDVDYAHHYFTMIEDGVPGIVDQLRRICCFDLLANNTDRKSGHCLLDDDGHVWAIDNALCFHATFKLRTVIWDFAGEPIDARLIDDVSALLERGLPETLGDHLDAFERDALCTRAHALVRDGHFPVDTSGHRYPWPLI